MQRYIKQIDRKDRALCKTHAWLAPILDDFSSTSDYVFSAKPHHDLAEDIQAAIVSLSLNMRNFILGLDFQVQVDVDLQDIIFNVQLLRKLAKSPDARHNLAVLEGIFSSYEPIEVDALVFASSATGEEISVYRDLIDDAAYRLLSTHVHGMGWFEQIEFSRVHIERLIRDLLRNPRFSAMLDVGQQIIFASTRMPIPDSSALARLVGNNYLPPIVGLTDLVHRARVSWKPDSVDIRTVDPERETLRMVMDTSNDWNPYRHLHENVRKKIDSNTSISVFEVDGWVCKLRDVRHINTYMPTEGLRLEMILSNGLSIVLAGEENIDPFMNAYSQWVHYCQEVAYKGVGAPYGRTKDGQHRWLWEQAQAHRGSDSP